MAKLTTAEFIEAIKELSVLELNDLVKACEEEFGVSAAAGVVVAAAGGEAAAAEEKTVGGIIIPDTAKEKPLQGKVLAVGNGTKDEEMFVKEGDTVLYGKYAGTELEYEGKKYLVMRQNDILAILG